MLQLPTTNPEAAAFLESGGFVVQRSENPFAQVASDLAIEQTINRSSKTTGGIIGISLNPSAVQRWVMTAHDRARFCRFLSPALVSSVDLTTGPVRLMCCTKSVICHACREMRMMCNAWRQRYVAGSTPLVTKRWIGILPTWSTSRLV
eukprot:scpid6314/ scgid34826/ 